MCSCVCVCGSIEPACLYAIRQQLELAVDDDGDMDSMRIGLALLTKVFGEFAQLCQVLLVDSGFRT